MSKSSPCGERTNEVQMRGVGKVAAQRADNGNRGTWSLRCSGLSWWFFGMLCLLLQVSNSMAHPSPHAAYIADTERNCDGRWDGVVLQHLEHCVDIHGYAETNANAHCISWRVQALVSEWNG